MQATSLQSWLKAPTIPFSTIKEGDDSLLGVRNVRVYEFDNDITIAMAFCEDLPSNSKVSNGTWAVYVDEGKICYKYIGYRYGRPLIVNGKAFMIVGEYFAELGFLENGVGVFAAYEPVMLTSGWLEQV